VFSFTLLLCDMSPVHVCLPMTNVIQFIWSCAECKYILWCNPIKQQETYRLSEALWSASKAICNLKLLPNSWEQNHVNEGRKIIEQLWCIFHSSFHSFCAQTHNPPLSSITINMNTLPTTAGDVVSMIDSIAPPSPSEIDANVLLGAVELMTMMRAVDSPAPALCQLPPLLEPSIH